MAANKTTKVRAKGERVIAGPGVVHHGDGVYEVPAALGRQLVKDGHAEEHRDDAPGDNATEEAGRFGRTAAPEAKVGFEPAPLLDAAGEHPVGDTKQAVRDLPGAPVAERADKPAAGETAAEKSKEQRG